MGRSRLCETAIRLFKCVVSAAQDLHTSRGRQAGDHVAEMGTMVITAVPIALYRSPHASDKSYLNQTASLRLKEGRATQVCRLYGHHGRVHQLYGYSQEGDRQQGDDRRYAQDICQQLSMMSLSMDDSAAESEGRSFGSGD